MKRNVDLECSCGQELLDVFLGENQKFPCPKCGGNMKQIWWARRTQQATCWADSEAVVVFEKPPGTYKDHAGRFSFPARNDKACPPGWTKHVARSDREVGKLEELTKTRNQDRWFDRGAGRGFDDTFRGKEYN